MPQLMPLMWNISMFMMILMLVLLMSCYGNLMKMDLTKLMFFHENVLNKWYW